MKHNWTDTENKFMHTLWIFLFSYYHFKSELYTVHLKHVYFCAKTYVQTTDDKSREKTCLKMWKYDTNTYKEYKSNKLTSIN